MSSEDSRDGKAKGDSDPGAGGGRRAPDLSILARVAARVHGLNDVDAILDAALEELLACLGLETAWILLRDEKESGLQLAASRGISLDYLQSVKAGGLGECLCRDVLRTGESMQARNTTECPRMPMIGKGHSSLAHACIPLSLGGERRGVLNVAARPGEVFAPSELRVLETLGHQIAVAVERAMDLKSAQARILRAEGAVFLGNFAASLAHEIRNPLNTISLQLSVADRRISRLEGGLGDELRGLVGIIRGEVRRLDSLVGDFLLFSQARELHLAPGSLTAVADDAVNGLREAASEAGVRLVRRELDGDLAISLDREKMRQAIQNLIQNAIDVAPGGEVVVTTGLIDGRPTISVRDGGPGLPAGVDVFQLFVTTKAQGTGLGLPIAQQIVVDHGGEIAATSVAGGGALFTVSRG